MEIQFMPIWEVFVLYCALNANGYDKENASEMHPVRQKVRNFLKNKSFQRYDFKWNPYQYVKQVLTTNKLAPTDETNPDFVEVLGYLRGFEKEADLEEIWSMIKNETELVLDQYRPEVETTTEKLKQVLKLDEPTERLIVSVNLLESYFRGFSITLEDKVYLIIGPSDKPNLRNFLHELLHAYIKNADFEREPNKDLYRRVAEELKPNYPVNTIIEESIVRALVVYLGKKLGLEKTELSEQDKKLVFPELLLGKLIQINPEMVTVKLFQELAKG